MKQAIDFKPAFNPTSKTLDFYGLNEFQIGKLYAVINLTRNVLIYAVGNSATGLSNLNGYVVTLAFDTTSHSSTDQLMVIYDLQSSIFNFDGLLERIAMKVLTKLTFATNGSLRVQTDTSVTQPVSGTVTATVASTSILNGSATQVGTSIISTTEQFQLGFRRNLIVA